MGLQRKNPGLTPVGVGGHDRIRHQIRRDREGLVVKKLAVNGGARGEALATINTWTRRVLSILRQDFVLHGRLACTEALSRK